MKSEELRIGNYYNENGEYKKVCVNVIQALRVSDRIWIKPIELTSEIISKTSFYYCLDSESFMISDCTLKLYDYYDDGFMCVIFGNELRFIKYLHELQNLYFALTGEELEIKL